MKTALDLEYKKDLYVDLFLPESEEFDLFIYIHGGGLAELSRKNVDVFAKTLAEKNIATASVEYSMYPKAKFPDFIEDCAEAVAWVFKHIKEYGECKGIYAGGSSAGGYISMMLQFDKKYLQKHGIDPTDLAGYIHDAGQPTAHFNVLKERGIDSRRVIIDNSAPLFHIGNGTKYPPMLIIVSDNDMQNRYEQTMLVMSTLKHFGQGDVATLKLMHGTHTEYLKIFNEDGTNVFANLVEEYINAHI